MYLKLGNIIYMYSSLSNTKYCAVSSSSEKLHESKKHTCILFLQQLIVHFYTSFHILDNATSGPMVEDASLGRIFETPGPYRPEDL